MAEPVGWFGIVTVIATNLAGILLALATLISVIKGSFNLLNDKLDGHMKDMVDAVKTAGKVEGKVDALIQSTPQTTVIQDRRKE